jgi:hypothetical protein
MGNMVILLIKVMSGPLGPILCYFIGKKIRRERARGV